jgi:DNA-binding beta-propeller fold protein YncE
MRGRRRRRIILPLKSLGIIGGEDNGGDNGGGEEPEPPYVGVWDLTNIGSPYRYDISAQATVSPYAVCFNEDGTKGYVACRNSNDNPDRYVVHQYTLDNPCEFKTGGVTHDNKTFKTDTTNQVLNQPLYDMQWTDSGNSLIYCWGVKDIYQAFASTPYDLSTLSITTVVKQTVSTYDFYSFFINSNGTRLYIADSTNGAIKEYSLSTAFDITTLTYTNRSLSVTSIITASNVHTGLDFKPDLRKMFISNYNDEKCYQFSLEESGNIDTATFDNKILNIDAGNETTGVFGFSMGLGDTVVASVSKTDNVEIITFPLL